MSNSTALQYGDSQTEKLKSISDGSFAQQKQVLDAVPVGIFVVDAMHRITFFNRKAEQITGIQAHEAIGAKCGTTLKPTHCGPNCPAQRLHKTGQEQLDFVSAFTSTDGALISVRLSVTRTEHIGSTVFTFDALRERERGVGSDTVTVSRDDPVTLNTVIVTGTSQLPISSADERAPRLVVEVEISRSDDQVVDVACAQVSKLIERMLRVGLMGKRLTTGITDTLETVDRRCHTPQKKALMAALTNLMSRYENLDGAS